MSAFLEIPQLPYTETVWENGGPVEGECVEFRLIYAGNQLVADGDATQKHVIRKALHPQLKHLWASNFLLSDMARRYGLVANRNTSGMSEDEIARMMRETFFAKVGNLYSRGNFHFVPLIEQSLCLRVSLDILFLRRDQHPLIKAGGDIDNRLKTLFDAFRVPETTAGLGGVPEDGEDPFFVLMQDDCLISEVRVNTDNLLLLPQNTAPSAKDCFLVIDVKLRPTQKTTKSWAFE